MLKHFYSVLGVVEVNKQNNCLHTKNGTMD